MWCFYYETLDLIQHPVENWRIWRKRRNRPKIGDKVRDCRDQVHKVVAYGNDKDDLILDDGACMSWMHCCEPAEREEMS